eukprot:CAMPEP_0198339962 /NCGR_PEP_ID=MMETSP1450-20131203/41594_1 /TAXON_ID=753684 ORGANISM="Madagascaria erythrocladiodes, Strain CCMP3234" /NCGR_SAMPLE_ID=MMETSP1450 /ASSEMBLY_ACC=CAM_ASM_001115 /LENGTH=123 /DNA_ID=CAMNT_0044044921 /DNA_START=283 /DNA_END=652 /DNA_ORIENTATION=-
MWAEQRAVWSTGARACVCVCAVVVGVWWSLVHTERARGCVEGAYGVRHARVRVVGGVVGDVAVVTTVADGDESERGRRAVAVVERASEGQRNTNSGASGATRVRRHAVLPPSGVAVAGAGGAT